MTTNTLGPRARAALLDSQRRVLERIASGAPLAEVLETLVRLIEEQAQGTRCAVLLADSQRQRLSFAAAPSIPEDYKASIEPFLRIAPSMGSCATAAFLREPVYTRDTGSDVLWKDCGDIAVRNGLRAIWSTPVVSDDNDVLGTFAMYYGEPRLPSAEDIQLIDMATQVARVAIERKRADDALRQSEFELAEAQRVARLGSWTFDIAANTLRWSEELYRIFDVEKTAVGGTYETFLSRVRPDDRTRVSQVNAEARSSGKPFELEYSIQTRSGELKHISEVGYCRKDSAGAVSGLFGTAQDITERKKAENALRGSAFQLQALSRRLVELQESERKELARELHDRVGQNLTALNINLAILREALSRHDAGIGSRLADSASLLESTVQAIENVVSDLRPPMLDDHGLAPALDWYAKQFSARAGIAVSVRASDPDERVAAEMEIALFRIAQEALNNVAKHARARRVVIALQGQGSEYVMSVADDGVGLRALEKPADRARPGLGMVTMRERAQAVGGRFQVESLPGGGTRLTVRIQQ